MRLLCLNAQKQGLMEPHIANIAVATNLWKAESE